jgi:spore coat protein A
MALLVLFAGVTSATASGLLDPVSHPKFVNPLPIPARIDVTASQIDKDGDKEEVPPGRGYSTLGSLGNPNWINMDMAETVQWLGLEYNGTPVTTTVWGYGTAQNRVSFPGPTLVAMRDVPVSIQWRNKLPMYNFPGGPGPHLLPVDPNIHIAYPLRGGIPTVTHLHGGHTESASDGLPEAWYTQSWRETGPHYVKRTYTYDNDQEAATLWYHDHALGITRLNVYAGLAGFYLLRDDNELGLIEDGTLPGSPYEIEIAIQDRMFTQDGELFYPSEDPEIEPGFDPLPEGPSVIAEFFGDFILVNGVTWPKLEVEPRKYRLRFLNGSDSRFYVLEFKDNRNKTAKFLQIGTDNGLLPKPVELRQLLFAPGERADLVVDFADLNELTLLNFGPDDPFKGFNDDGTLSDGEGGALPPADPATTGTLMKFEVTLPLDEDVPDATVTKRTTLRPDIIPLEQTGETRNLVLFEGLDEFGRLQPLLGTLEEGSLAWFEPITENPMLDDVEVWEVYNATEDAHPIHLHLVSFQIMERESFTGTVEEKDQPQHNGTVGVGGILTVDSLGDDARPPEPNERGWKDTAVMLPGEVTRVIARFDRTGRYVWHCHILSHEDHEMMRPFEVGIPAAALGIPSATSSMDRSQTPNTQIRFLLPAAGSVGIRIFNVLGQEIRNLGTNRFEAGDIVLPWDGRDDRGSLVPSGVYFYRVNGDSYTHTNRLTVLK